MPPCLIHLGQPKTGTTSIQSTLFRHPFDAGFRLITLDSFHGNRAILAAFSESPAESRSYFLAGVPRRRLPRLASVSRDYLDHALAAARRRGAVPLLSAETAWWFSEAEFLALRTFVEQRGFEPRVIAYVRAPLDQMESTIQQMVRVGRPDLWACITDLRSRSHNAEVIHRLDASFGRENVSLHPFDPDRFPGRCVVRHFCGIAGIETVPETVVRENDSLGLHAVRFLHTFNQAAAAIPSRWLRRAERAALEQALAGLPGPPLRLHDSLAADFERLIRNDLAWLEGRLGSPLPLTLARRRPDSGLRSESDLFEHAPEALDWLAERTGRRPLAPGAPAADVADRLARLARRSVSTIATLAGESIALLRRRRLQARRMLT